MTLAAGARRRRRTSTPGARPRRRPPPALAATTSSIRALRRATGSPTHDRAGHVGAVAVDDARRSRCTTSSPALDATRSPGRAWGLAPLGPDADDRLEAVPSAPQPAHLGVELERELVLGRTRRAAAAAPAPSASSAIDAAASMRATSPSSFTRRSASTRPSVGTSSAPANQSVGVARAAAPR